MKIVIFSIVMLFLCAPPTRAQDEPVQNQRHRLTYEEVLQKWDSSRAYGDPRDLHDFSQAMVFRMQAGLESDDYFNDQ